MIDAETNLRAVPTLPGQTKATMTIVLLLQHHLNDIGSGPVYSPFSELDCKTRLRAGTFSDGRPAFEKTGIRFCDVDWLKIDSDHSRTRPSPDDQHMSSRI
jgi:hypothetical protein